MENVINNPGFQHLVEYIFLNLNIEDLKKCLMINQSANHFLDNPILWKKLFQRGCLSINVETRRELSYVRRHLIMKNQNDWITAIELEMNSDKGTNIVKYLKWILKKGDIFDLPCYTSSAVQKDFRRNIITSVQQSWPWNRQTEIIKMLAPLTDNPNSPDENGKTPIYLAAWKGISEIVKILAPLTDNPNAPNENGDTPIHIAACNGHTEIIMILAPLTNNPNVQNERGYTPIYQAASYGHTEIVKMLALLTDNPNLVDKFGETPIHRAAWNGHTEIVKTLSSLTDNPNAHDQTGRTPIYWAAWKGNTEIVKILAPLTDNPNAPNTAGETPIHNASCNGHAEIIKILAPLTVNPNAPDNIGRTPIQIAKNEDIRRIIESFNVSTNRNVRKRARSKKEPKSDDIVVHFKNIFISKRARKS